MSQARLPVSAMALPFEGVFFLSVGRAHSFNFICPRLDSQSRHWHSLLGGNFLLVEHTTSIYYVPGSTPSLGTGTPLMRSVLLCLVGARPSRFARGCKDRYMAVPVPIVGRAHDLFRRNRRVRFSAPTRSLVMVRQGAPYIHLHIFINAPIGSHGACHGAPRRTLRLFKY
jgi:hypothetical protein